jgi:hypothetical protein
MARVGLILLLITLLAACASGPNVERSADGSTVTLILNENEMSELVRQMMAIDRSFFREPTVDLGADQITLTGDYVYSDGREPARGSVTLAPVVTNCQIFFTLADIGIPNVSETDVQLAALNEWLAVRLIQRARRVNRGDLEALSISDGDLRIVIANDEM